MVFFHYVVIYKRWGPGALTNVNVIRNRNGVSDVGFMFCVFCFLSLLRSYGYNTIKVFYLD